MAQKSRYERRRSKFQNLIEAPLQARAEEPGLPTQNVDRALNEIAQRVMTVLNAAAVAIAVESGGEIVCRARAGFAAPEVGTVVQADRGITGECISKAEVVRCNNVANDERVDAAVCEQLGVRSLVAVPLLWGGRAVGVIEAFFTAANAFRSQSIEYLKHAAEQIAVTTYGAQPESRETPTSQTEQETTLPELIGKPLSPFETEEFQRLFEARDIETQETPPAQSDLIANSEAPPNTGDSESGALSSVTAVPEERTAPIWKRPPVYVALIFCALMAVAAVKLSHREAAPEAKPTVTAMDPAAQLQLKADGGDASAQYKLAQNYKNGSGVPADAAQAKTWLVRAANSGNANAQLDLAASAEHSGNLKEAYTWYVIAGLAGKTESEQPIRRLTPKLSAREIAQVRYDIGERLAAGGTLPKDPVAAYVWFALSDWGGNKNARQPMQQLQSQMSQEQLRDARSRASTWMRRHTATPVPNPEAEAATTTGP
jgi:TPR repeat protein